MRRYEIGVKYMYMAKEMLVLFLHLFNVYYKVSLRVDGKVIYEIIVSVGHCSDVKMTTDTCY